MPLTGASQGVAPGVGEGSAAEYGATLEVRQASGPMLAPVPLYSEAWRRQATDDLRQAIAAAFFSLAWVGMEDAG